MAQLNKIEDQEIYKKLYANSDWIVFKALGSRDVAFAIKLDALPMAPGQSLLVNAKYFSWDVWSKLFFRSANSNIDASAAVRRIKRGAFVEVQRVKHLLDIDFTRKQQIKTKPTLEIDTFSAFICF
ncbi:TPA: hypothetical protein RQN21_004500 [Aeromonas hydrophila]|nr:hypothetical protein [Aeromonas hydrophila]